MLCLSRKPGQKIVIGDNIEIVIVEIDRDKVRLGFDAPPEVKIWRSELLPIVQAADIGGEHV